MNKEWLDYLMAAAFDADLEYSGEVRLDARRAASETVIASLSHLGLIQAEGDDGRTAATDGSTYRTSRAGA